MRILITVLLMLGAFCVNTHAQTDSTNAVASATSAQYATSARADSASSFSEVTVTFTEAGEQATGRSFMTFKSPQPEFRGYFPDGIRGQLLELVGSFVQPVNLPSLSDDEVYRIAFLFCPEEAMEIKRAREEELLKH